MVIQIDEQMQFEVTFDPLDREPGYDDDIRFAMHETRPQNLLAADTVSILLTPEQAAQLARQHSLISSDHRVLPP